MVVLRGYVCKPQEHDSSGGGSQSDAESDSDDDVDELDWEDLAIGTQGDFRSSTSGSKKRTIHLQILEDEGRKHTSKTRKVSGRFDLRFLEPFWMVTVEVEDKGSLCFANSPGHYRIREDDGVGPDVVSLFLKSSDVNAQHIASFLEFASHASSLRCSLKDLPKNLEAFGDSSPQNGSISFQIQQHLRGSIQGRSFLCSNLTQYIHQLLPRKAPQILENLPLDVLQKLEKALTEEPWIFGYREIMHQRFGQRYEAKLKALKDCELFDQMSQDMRAALQIYHTATSLFRKKGHTFILLKDLKNNKDCRDIQDWEKPLQFLTQKEILVEETSRQDEKIVFLPDMKQCELEIAKNVTGLMIMGKQWMSVKIDEQKAFHGDADQIKAARLIASRPVVVMSGKGGCGKTHVICEVLQGMETDRTSDDGVTSQGGSNNESTECAETDETVGPILLTAPTGKASSILGRRTGLEAFTLHSVICSFYHYLRKKYTREQSGPTQNASTQQDNPWKFSSVCMLVCDECSLVSVRTFARLLGILREHAQIKQLVLLGDINQLPSIEPGNFLSDIYQALQPHGLSVNLTTNHRSESDLIVANADEISKRQLPKYDPERGFEAVTYGTGAEELTIPETVKRILKEKELSQKESQIIAFRRKDCLHINELCALHYNRHSLKDHKGRADFRVGDKVSIGRNQSCSDLNKNVDVRLCNGEIFFIQDDVTVQDTHSKAVRYLTLDDGERQLKIDFRELRKAKLKHAWAKTIHTYQGSEIATVVYVVGKHWYQNWQHVYTAVTRGRSRVCIVADPQELRQSVETSPTKRFTRLKDFLEEKTAVLARQPQPSVPTDLRAAAAQANSCGVPEDELGGPGGQATVLMMTTDQAGCIPACDQPIQEGPDVNYSAEESQKVEDWPLEECFRRSMDDETDCLPTMMTSSPKESHVTSLVDVPDDDDMDLARAVEKFESSVDGIEFSKVTLEDDTASAAISFSRKNLHRNRAAEKSPVSLNDTSPTQSPARASEPFPPNAATPDEAGVGNEICCGARRDSASGYQTPPGTPRRPGSQMTAISCQSSPVPLLSPSKRKGKPVYESPGKRPRGAIYETTCSACGMRIHIGDLITKMRDRWVHSACGDEA